MVRAIGEAFPFEGAILGDVHRAGCGNVPAVSQTAHGVEHGDEIGHMPRAAGAAEIDLVGAAHGIFLWRVDEHGSGLQSAGDGAHLASGEIKARGPVADHFHGGGGIAAEVHVVELQIIHRRAAHEVPAHAHVAPHLRSDEVHAADVAVGGGELHEIPQVREVADGDECHGAIRLLLQDIAVDRQRIRRLLAVFETMRELRCETLREARFFIHTRPLDRAHGKIRPMVVAIDGINGRASRRIERAGHGGEDLALALVRQHMQHGERARVIAIRGHVRVEKDPHRLAAGGGAEEDEAQEEVEFHFPSSALRLVRTDSITER